MYHILTHYSVCTVLLRDIQISDILPMNVLLHTVGTNKSIEAHTKPVHLHSHEL